MEIEKPLLRRVGASLLEASRAMFNQDTPRDAAAISYFSLIALFPSVLVLIALVDAFLGWLNLHRIVLQRIVALFPGSRAFLRENLSQLTTPSAALVISCVVVVLWSSTWIFTFLENALNRAWGVSRHRTFWESRVRGITLMVVGGILLLISAGITIVVGAARARATGHIKEFEQDQIINWIWSSILIAAGFLIAILVFLVVYKLMPDRKVAWLEALSGAVVAAALWESGSYIFVKLVPFFDSQKVYGKTGTIIALMVWVYTSSFMILFSAHFAARLHSTKTAEQQPIAKPRTRSLGRGRPWDKIRAFPRPRA